MTDFSYIQQHGSDLDFQVNVNPWYDIGHSDEDIWDSMMNPFEPLSVLSNNPIIAERATAASMAKFAIATAGYMMMPNSIVSQAWAYRIMSLGMPWHQLASPWAKRFWQVALGYSALYQAKQFHHMQFDVYRSGAEHLLGPYMSFRNPISGM